MSADKPVSLAERIADWCPFIDSPDGCTDTCPWPLHSLEAEAKALERQAFGEHTLAQEWQGRAESAEARVEALVEVLRSAPEIPEDDPEDLFVDYAEWLAKRAAALAGRKP